MTKEIWLNLPVKDLEISKAFFSNLGFSFNTKFGNSDVSAGMLVGSKKVVVMLFAEHVFKSFIQGEVADTKKGSEILISIDAESKEEVDELAKKAAEAGGNVFAPPADSQGWMYGCAFADLDGHRWNVLYMDFSKLS